LFSIFAFKTLTFHKVV